MERKFKQDSNLKQQYNKFLDEYQEMQHMSLIEEADDSNLPSYYLPHHAVLNEESETTKLRVVFDGSCQSNSGLSLNDILMTGPTIQEDLISIVMRFRQYPYVITADVSKMYRQVRVVEKHRTCNVYYGERIRSNPFKHSN
jgi:hypothetical protein